MFRFVFICAVFVCFSDCLAHTEKSYSSTPAEFLTFEEAPRDVQHVAHASVRRLCTCFMIPDNCITMTNVLRANHYLPNQHAVSFLFGRLEAARTERATEGRKCDFEYAGQNAEGESVPVKIDLVKSGKIPQDRPRIQWNPENHFAIPVSEQEDYSEDLSLIKVDVSLDAVPIEFAARNPPKGSEIFHMGFPAVARSKDYEVVDGKVTGLHRDPSVSRGTVQDISARSHEGDFLVQNGTSGGPVVDRDGKLVGIAWGKSKTFREAKGDEKAAAQECISRLGYPRERSFFIPLAKIRAFLSGKN